MKLDKMLENGFVRQPKRDGEARGLEGGGLMLDGLLQDVSLTAVRENRSRCAEAWNDFEKTVRRAIRHV